MSACRFRGIVDEVDELIRTEVLYEGPVAQMQGYYENETESLRWRREGCVVIVPKVQSVVEVHKCSTSHTECWVVAVGWW